MVSKSQYVIAVVLSLVCVVCFFMPVKIGIGSSGTDHLWSAMLISSLAYHFFHANFFHLCINVWGLASFRPRISTVVVGYLSSTIVALCPLVALEEPTYGLSAFLFACYARSFARYRWNLWRLILPQIIVGLLPHMNWRIHLLSFFLSYVIWRIYYDKRRV